MCLVRIDEGRWTPAQNVPHSVVGYVAARKVQMPFGGPCYRPAFNHNHKYHLYKVGLPTTAVVRFHHPHYDRYNSSTWGFHVWAKAEPAHKLARTCKGVVLQVKLENIYAKGTDYPSRKNKTIAGSTLVFVGLKRTILREI